MRRKWTFSKLLLLLESAVVLYTTYEGFALARLAVGYGCLLYTSPSPRDCS